MRDVYPRALRPASSQALQKRAQAAQLLYPHDAERTMTTPISTTDVDASRRARLRWTCLSLAIALRLVIAFFHEAPCHPDAAYALSVARSIAQGRGAVDRFVLWNVVEPLLHAAPLPPLRPANSFWLPLPQWLALPGVWLGEHLRLSPEHTHILAALPGGLTAAWFPIVAIWLNQYVDMKDERRRRLGGALAFLFALLPARATFLAGAVDTMAPAGALFWAALIVLERAPMARVASRGAVFAVVAGLMLGLACLARGEFLVLTLLYAVFRWRTSDVKQSPLRPLSLAIPLLMVGLFSLHLAYTFGRLTPATGQALWLREYEELFAWNYPLSHETLLRPSVGESFGAHLWALLRVRLTALVQVPLVISLQLAGPLALLALPGLYAVRGKLPPTARASGLATLLVLSLLALAFPLAAMHGTAYHDGGVLLPLLAVLVAQGIIALMPPAVWQASEASARRFDTALVLAMLALLAGSAWHFSDADRRDARRSPDERALASWLRTHADEARGGVLTMHAAQLHWDTELVTYQLPSNGLSAALDVTRERDLGLWVIPSRHPHTLDEAYTSESGVLEGLTFERVHSASDGTHVVHFASR